MQAIIANATGMTVVGNILWDRMAGMVAVGAALALGGWIIHATLL